MTCLVCHREAGHWSSGPSLIGIEAGTSRPGGFKEPKLYPLGAWLQKQGAAGGGVEEQRSV